MKRKGYLYEKIIDKSNCRKAIINAAKHKGNRKKVQEILAHIDEYTEDLSNRLQSLDFVSPYHLKTISDGLSGKTRTIAVPRFYPDQCAHHAIVQIIRPIFEKSSYYWSCANIPKRGIKRACIGVERATIRDQKHAKYCVQMDVRHYYPTIPHSLLKSKLRRKIKDVKALTLLDIIIDSYHSDEGEDRGIPIGNYTSPWFAELFLQDVDWKIKHEFHIPHYVRYADDMVLIGNNKRKLRKAMESIIKLIASYGMNIKPNYQLYKIFKDGRGRKIDFVGRCFAKGFTTIRKRRALACMRQSRKIQRYYEINHPISVHLATSFLSRSSCVLHTSSLGFRRKYVYPTKIKLLKEVVSNESKRQYLTRCGDSRGQCAA